MSRVFAGFDEALQRKVAIKVLAPELAESLSIERFRREIMLGASLQHPNIVPVLSAGETAGLPFFVMPFVEGQSLRARLRRGPLSIRETVSVMRDVARALAFAHDRGIVHRDIKPDNVMLTGGVATVTDFGVAKAVAAARGPGRTEARTARFSTLTSAGVAIGTPTYMAPEQAAGDPDTDHRADLYSLGIVGYEMLTGAPPFQGRTLKHLMAEQFAGTPPPLASRRTDVPADLTALIMQCLAKSPEDRPKTATALVRTLENPDFASGTFTATAPAPGGRRLTRREILRAAVPLGLLSLVALGYAFWPLHLPKLGIGAAAAPATATILVPTIRSADSGVAAAPAGQVIAEQIAAGLARLQGVEVAGPPTADVLARGLTAETAGTGRTLVLDGFLQRTATRVRLTVRLLDQRGFTLWGEAFDATSADPLVVQDELTRGLLAGLVPQVEQRLGVRDASGRRLPDARSGGVIRQSGYLRRHPPLRTSDVSLGPAPSPRPSPAAPRRRPPRRPPRRPTPRRRSSRWSSRTPRPAGSAPSSWTRSSRSSSPCHRARSREPSIR